MMRRPPRSTLLSLHDALPIWLPERPPATASDAELILRAYEAWGAAAPVRLLGDFAFAIWDPRRRRLVCRSEEHTSELQSRQYLVCRLLLEKNRASNRSEEQTH